MENELTYHVVIAVVIVAGFYFLAQVVRWMLAWIGRRVFAKTENVLDDKILAVVIAHVNPLMLIIGLHIALREIGKGVTAEDVTAEQMLEYGASILYIAVVLLVFKIFLGILRELIHWYLDRVSGEGAVNLKMTLGPLTTKVTNVLVGLVAVIIVLDHFGISIGSLLVSLGVGSLAVALAAQDTLANMIAGFVILVDRPFRVGDRIEVADGQVGDVREIGLRSTKLLNFDSNLIIIPNAELVKSRIVNHAYPFNQTRVVLRVGVAYGTDATVVRRILTDLALNQSEVLREPPPEVHCTALGDSAVEFTLTARVVDYTKKFAAETALREKAYITFAKEGIEIPFPQQVVHTKGKG